MAKRKKRAQSDPFSDWAKEDHREIATLERGIGFARFDAAGDRVRGHIREFHRGENGPYVLMELSEDPVCRFVSRDDDTGEQIEVTAEPGTMVYVGVNNVDLERKVTRDMLGQEVGIGLAGTQQVRKGAMKVYHVVVFSSDLPF